MGWKIIGFVYQLRYILIEDNEEVLTHQQKYENIIKHIKQIKDLCMNF